MNAIVSLLFGPLAGPESRRALGRGWVVILRALAGAALMGVPLVTLWWWWMVQQSDLDHQPIYELRIGLITVAGMMLTIALLQGPAVLAGSLAGEKQRGVLALLLSTRVTAYEIIAGRVVGKLSQVGMILMAGVPALILLASLAGIRAQAVLLMILVPAAVGFGGGGMAALASTVSKRGRDALLAVYLADVIMLFGSQASTTRLPALVADVLASLTPFSCLGPLVWAEEVRSAWLTVGSWTVIGASGIALASWRLRPACLGTTRSNRKTAVRRAWVPPVDERRPMLWKELFIERVASLGRFGHWTGVFTTLALSLGSAALFLSIYLGPRFRPDEDWAGWARIEFDSWVVQTAPTLLFLVQWAVGLRAAVSISSERERGTWDALLTSPLSAGEIVRGKLWGSYYALRLLIAATALAWLLAWLAGAWPLEQMSAKVINVLVASMFMAAVGVRTSLSCETATRAMAITIGCWLAAYVAVGLLTALMIATGLMVVNATLLALAQLGYGPPFSGFWAPRTTLLWPLASDFVYLGVTLTIVADTSLRFDRLAGRMTEGALSVAFEQAVHGRPELPVLIEEAEAAEREREAALAAQAEESVAGPA